MFRAERIKRKPNVAACFAAELSHHRQVSLIRSDDHAAAEEVKDRPFGRFRPFADDQARKSVDIDHLIMRLMVFRRKNAAAAVLLFDDLPDLIFRQPKCFLAPEILYALRNNKAKILILLPPLVSKS